MSCVARGAVICYVTPCIVARYRATVAPLFYPDDL